MEQTSFVKLLTANGLQPNAARVLACFTEDDVLTALDLETMARLRQPEVSQATTYLIERGWLSYDRVRKEGRGRPVHHYHLAKSWGEICEEIVCERGRDIAGMMQDLNALRAVA